MTRLLTCEVHPRYSTTFPPQHRDCGTCWAAYGRRRAYDDGLRSRGRAKGGGASSKAKGREVVLRVAALLVEYLYLDAADVLVKATSQGGTDIHLSSAAKGRFPFSIEVKGSETLNIWAALAQAQANATPEYPPVLFFKRAKSTLFVALSATSFMRLLKGILDDNFDRKA